MGTVIKIGYSLTLLLKGLLEANAKLFKKDAPKTQNLEILKEKQTQQRSTSAKVTKPGEKQYKWESADDCKQEETWPLYDRLAI